MKSKLKQVSMIVLALALVISMVPLDVYAGEFSYTEIIQPKYEDAKTFSEGLAAVKKNGKWGYIDEDDNIVLDFDYDVAHDFRENKAVVGEVKVEKSEWSDENNVNLYWGVIDRSGNYKPFMTSYGEHFHYSFFEDDAEELIGSYSETDQEIYHNGMVMLSVYDGPHRFLFDSNGKDLNQVFNHDYPMHTVTEDILAVSDGYLDSKGNRLFKDKDFVETKPFNQGLAAVALDNNDYWNLMDTRGNILSNIEFSEFYINDIYGSYSIFNDNSLLSMRNNLTGNWGAVNKAGETKIPFKYENLKSFNEGVAGFKLGGKFGFVDVYGNEIIKPQFDDVSSFANGLAAVAQGNNAYIIDKKGGKVAGTENLPKDSYFVDKGDSSYVVYSPGKYVLKKENSKYGFGKIDYTPALPTVEEMSSWALDEVVLAIENDLVPANLQNMYKTDITRVDFAALVVKAIEEVTGEEINEVLKKETGQSLYDLVSKYPFKDTTDQNVIAAQALKIIHGTGERQFAPNDTISRQDSAALLMRTAKFLGDDTELESKTFNDQDNIANYAKEAVNYVSSIDVMQGKENNNFGPKDSYTREQAYLTIYRLFDILVNK